VEPVSTCGRELRTSSLTAADWSYGEFYDFYSVSPENVGYHHVSKQVIRKGIIGWQLYTSTDFCQYVKELDIHFDIRGPRIVIYSYNNSQQGAVILNFILVKNSTCFGQIYCPSSGFLILYSEQLLFIILAMLTVCSEVNVELVSLSETRRVLYQNKVEK
jgi:hypothetical protein